MHKPVVGRIFGYGHFVFESAAQEQGLREIRFVGSPNERGLTIQRVIQRSGLRGPAGPSRPRASAASAVRADQADTAEMPWWRATP